VEEETRAGSELDEISPLISWRH